MNYAALRAQLQVALERQEDLQASADGLKRKLDAAILERDAAEQERDALREALSRVIAQSRLGDAE